MSVYTVHKRGTLAAIYDNLDAATAHAEALDKDGASVSLEVWKVRNEFDARLHNKRKALAKLAPEDLDALAISSLRTEASDYEAIKFASTLPSAGQEYLNRDH